MTNLDDDSDLFRLKERLEQDHRAAIIVWLNMLQRAPVDDVTWMRLGYSYLRLDELARAIAAFILSTIINPSGKGAKYLDPILKSSHEIPGNIIDLYVTEWLGQFGLHIDYGLKYNQFKSEHKEFC